MYINPTELLQVADPIIEVFGFEENTSALKEQVDQLLDEIHGHEKRLGSSYIRLGRLLGEVDDRRAWVGWGYTSLAGYITDIKDRIGRERSQIFEMISVAKKLLPQISESDLENMGISRASMLKKFVVQTQRRVTPELLSAALDSTMTVAKFKTVCYHEMKADEPIKGTWHDWGAYYEPDQWAEIQEAVQVARREIPIDGNQPDYVVRRDVLLAFAREFVSEYGK